MRYRVVIKELTDGRYHARCASAPFGVCEVTAASRDAVTEQMRKELRYRNEWCPCSGIAESAIELDVREETPAWQLRRAR